MTAPEQLIADALRERARTAPDDDAKAVLEALHAAGYDIIPVPEGLVQIEEVGQNLHKARLGQVTARVHDTKGLTHIIGETFLFNTPGQAEQYAGELAGIAAWVRGWETGTRG